MQWVFPRQGNNSGIVTYPLNFVLNVGYMQRGGEGCCQRGCRIMRRASQLMMCVCAGGWDDGMGMGLLRSGLWTSDFDQFCSTKFRSPVTKVYVGGERPMSCRGLKLTVESRKCTYLFEIPCVTNAVHTAHSLSRSITSKWFAWVEQWTIKQSLYSYNSNHSNLMPTTSFFLVEE